MCCKLDTDVAVVTFKCDGCGEGAFAEADIKHADKEHEKKFTQVCSKSGQFPHGGVPKKKE